MEAFNHCGVEVSPNTSVPVYYKLFIPAKNRTVIARTRQTGLRDNSCFVHFDGRRQCALLKKVVVLDGKEFAVAVPLSKATRQLCSDSVTNAKLNSHLCTFNPPL